MFKSPNMTDVHSASERGVGQGGRGTLQTALSAAENSTETHVSTQEVLRLELQISSVWSGWSREELQQTLSLATVAKPPYLDQAGLGLQETFWKDAGKQAAHTSWQ